MMITDATVYIMITDDGTVCIVITDSTVGEGTKYQKNITYYISSTILTEG